MSMLEDAPISPYDAAPENTPPVDHVAPPVSTGGGHWALEQAQAVLASLAAQPAAEPGSEATPEPAQPEGGDVTPAAAPDDPAAQAQPGPVPYNRFSEAVRERNELRAQIAELTAQAQAPAAPPPAPEIAPQERFQVYAEQMGVDIYDPETNPAVVRALQGAWAADERAAAVEARLSRFEKAQEAQSQEQARLQLQAEVQTGLAEVERAHPALRDNPHLRQDFLARYAFDADRGLSMQDSAAQFMARQEQLIANALTQYAAAKQTDAAVPVVSPGAAPQPVERPNIWSLSPEARRTYLASHLEAANAPVP